MDTAARRLPHGGGAGRHHWGRSVTSTPVNTWKETGLGGTTIPTWGRRSGESSWSAGAEATTRPTDAGERYRFVEYIGRGGFGEVWQVVDPVLARPVAAKVLRRRWSRSRTLVERLCAEARIASQLRHPGIIAVHDVGWTSDKRPFFVMPLAGGRPWNVVAEASPHALGFWVGCITALAEVVEYAHGRGIVHRDLKPANVNVVGEPGSDATPRVETFDFGLAEVSRIGRVPKDQSWMSRAGTPGYVAPEVRRGKVATPAVDLYALGVMLREVLDRSIAQPQELAVPDVEELHALSQACTAIDPALRPDASHLLRELRGWMVGWTRRADLARHLEDASRAETRAEGARSLVRAHQRNLRRLRRIAESSTGQPQQQVEVWQAMERVREARAAMAEADASHIMALLAAYGVAPTSSVVLRQLANLHQRRHRAALLRGDPMAAAQHSAALATFDRGAHSVYRSGQADLAIQGTAPNSRLSLLPFRQAGQMKVLDEPCWEGPACGAPIPATAGSYVLRLSAGGFADAYLPVWLLPGDRWSHEVEPGTVGPVHMLADAEVDGDEIYVPAGWHWYGGDPAAPGATDLARVFTDGIVARRYPVTLSEYAAFLTWLEARQGPDCALEHAPRRGGPAAKDRVQLLTRGPDGWVAEPACQREPVRLIRPRDALRYAEYERQRTGQHWRLPTEVEWQRLARGADLRLFPMGNHGDPAWFQCYEHRPNGRDPQVATVDAHPFDAGPTGVRGVAGNVMQMTSTRYSSVGTEVAPNGRWTEVPAHLTDNRTLCGGAWGRDTSRSRCCHRSPFGDHHSPFVGFRLVRSVERR